MFITPEKPHMYFDVDGTLVRPLLKGENFLEEDVSLIGGRLFKVNKSVVDDLRVCKARSHIVVVWSQGGSDWAATVVKALSLEKYVTVVMAKPSWYIDDRSPGEILDPTRWYDGKF